MYGKGAEQVNCCATTSLDDSLVMEGSPHASIIDHALIICRNLLEKLMKYGTIGNSSEHLVFTVREGQRMSDNPPGHGEDTFEVIAQHIEHYRSRLNYIATLHMHPLLLKRISVDDVMQELYIAAHKRVEFWQKAEDVPPFVRLRTLVLQVITDLHRHHLAAQKRDIHREVSLQQSRHGGSTACSMTRWLIDSMTSPRSKMVRNETQRILHEAIFSLGESDQEVLSLRHFEELSNKETAAILGIEQKAASIRYVRALKKLQAKMADLTEFRP